MRNTIFLISILLLSINAIGQDYSLFNKNDTSVYKFNQSYPNFTQKYGCLKVDSIKTDSTDQIYFFPNTIAENDSCIGVSPTWIGPKLIERSDGTQKLLNKSGDTLIFKVRTDTVGSSWILCRYNPNRILHARRTADELIELQFLKDSVRKIELTLKDSAGNTVQDSINGSVIVISKNHGVVEGFDFYYSEYDSMQLKYKQVQLAGVKGLGGVEPLTREMVYDFDVGDEFHYDILTYDVKGKVDNAGSYEKITVLKKFRSISMVRYTVQKEKYERRHVTDLGYNFESIQHKTDTVQLGYGNLLMLYANLPGILPLNKSLTFHLDSIMNRIGLVNETSSEIFMWGKCAGFGEPFESYYYHQCAAGLGDWYSSSRNDGGQFIRQKRWLVYYKKRKVEWGTPATIPTNSSLTHKCVVYPNPSSGRVTISNKKLESIELVSINGNLIGRYKMDSNQQIDFSYLQNGLYLLKGILYDKPFVQRIQIQH